MNKDQALGMLKRERVQQQSVDGTQNGRVRADSQCDGKGGEKSKAEILSEFSCSVFYVLPKRHRMRGTPFRKVRQVELRKT
jgi:hypothetical protein